MSTPETTFLSIRVPGELRSRIKRLAAQREVSVQALVRTALEDFLREAEKAPPDLGATLATLRAHESEFRNQGVDHLYLFGSLVRGEAHRESDIDVAIDIAPDADVSLLDLIGIQHKVEDLLGWPTDLVERAALKRFVRPEMEREAVRAF